MVNYRKDSKSCLASRKIACPAGKVLKCQEWMLMFTLGFYLSPSDINGMRCKMEEFLLGGISVIGTDGFMQWRDDRHCQAVADNICDLGINCNTMHAPFGLNFLSKQDIRRSIEDNKRLVDVAVLWGCKNIVHHFRSLRTYVGDTHFAANAETAREEPARIDAAAAEVLPEICEYALGRGIHINLENLPLVSWARDPYDVLSFLRKMNIPNLKFLFDIGHANCSGYNVCKVIKDSGKLLQDVHFHDNFGPRNWDFNLTPDNSDIMLYDQHLPPGMGNIPWFGVVRALKEVNYSNPVMFEGPNSPAAVALTKSVWNMAEYLSTKNTAY